MEILVLLVVVLCMILCGNKPVQSVLLHVGSLCMMVAMCCCCSVIRPRLSQKDIPVDTVIVAKNWGYSGQWPEGKGIYMSYKQGLIIGDFKKTYPDGECYNIWVPKGICYWGEFQNGSRTGYGRIFRGKDVVVTGDVRKGKQHGIDTVYRANGSILIGRYENNKLIESILDLDYPPKYLRKLRPKFPKIKLTQEQKVFLEKANILYSQHKQQMRQERAAAEGKPIYKKGNFADFINANLVYPSQARMDRVQGRTLIRFVVTTEGTLKDIEIYSSSGNAELDAEALRCVYMDHTSPNWNPAKVDGVAIEKEIIFPVTFRLE